MALKKAKKDEIFSELTTLLDSSKMVVIAEYKGTTVKSMQSLRREAKKSGTTIKVVKNRIVGKALQASDTYKDIDVSNLTGMLMYAFNAEDEVAPAQNIKAFAKNEPQIQFVGAISADGKLLSKEDVISLADLPTKEQLRGQLVGTLAAPLTGFMRVVEGNIRGVLNVLNARSENIA